MRSERQHPDMIRSELQWLASLATVPSLLVPSPVRTRAGALLTTIALEHGTVACSLLRWVAGDPFPQIPSPQQAAQLGRLVATLHLHARSWSPPQAFVRPRYDVAFYERQMQGCSQVSHEGLLQPPEWTLLRRTLEQVFRELSAQPVSLQLIHADLHRGNLLVAGSQACLIDFAFCGWGSPLFDVGTGLLGLPSAFAAITAPRWRRKPPEYR